MVTKTDIARRAGVSRTCVSQILNHKTNARIAAQTRRRVLDLAQEMGYVAAPQQPANGGATFAYIFCHEDRVVFYGNWHTYVLTALQQCVGKDERLLMFLATSSFADSIRQTLRSIDRFPPAGIILDSVVPTTLVEEIGSRGIPFVVAGATPFAHEPQWAGRVSTVTIDVDGCVMAAMQWLGRQGARRILLVTTPLQLLLENLTLQAYRKACAAMEVEFDPELVQICPDPGNGSQVSSHCRELGIRYDGVLFASQPVAVATAPAFQAEAAREHQACVPMATLGAPGTQGSMLRQVAMSGVSCQQFSQVLYELLTERVLYPRRPHRNLVVPGLFREPASGGAM